MNAAPPFVLPLFDSSSASYWLCSIGEEVRVKTRVKPGLSAESSRNEAQQEPGLFADDVWPGALVLADYLDANAAELCTGKTVLEFGAGGGLPSVVAAKLGASRVCSTDYPANDVAENISRQFLANGVPQEVGHVLSFSWGSMTQAQAVLDCLGGRADTILMAELLWKDTYCLHKELLSSVAATLKRGSGRAILSLTHRPCPSHTRESDLEFLELAQTDFGFTVTPLGSSSKYADALAGGGGDEQEATFLYALALP